MFIWYIGVFLFGLIIGSFLNVVIYRLEKGEGVVKGRSYCPHCKHTLEWQDLLPVASFVFLQGECRYCRKKISWQYPVVEICTALIFLLIFNFQFPIFETLYLFVIASLLIVLFVYDLRHYILPDKILLPAIVISGIWSFVSGITLPTIYAALGAAAFFFAIFAFSKGRAMGFGDVKLAFFMGLFLGWPNILVALFLAFVIGGIIGIGLLAGKRKGWRSEIPFGPFLITGTVGAWVWGEELVNFYFSLMVV